MKFNTNYNHNIKFGHVTTFLVPLVGMYQISPHAPNHVEVVYKNEVLIVFKRYDMELTTSFKSITDFVRLLLPLLMNIVTS